MVTAISRQITTSTFWWKPWPVPSGVNQAIQDSFQPGPSPAQQLQRATNVLLDWRTDQIVNEEDRDHAKRWLKIADTTGRFVEDPLAHVLGAVFNGREEVWIHPALRKPDQYVALEGVIAHEIGGHLASFKGASGVFWGRIESYGGLWAHWLDPLSVLTCPFVLWISENGGLGAEWELAHRIPFEWRLDRMEAIRNSLGEHVSFLSLGSYFDRRSYRRRHFGDDLSKIARLAGLYMGYHFLVNAHLPKGRYIRRMRDLRFSELGAMIWRDVLFVDKARRKQVIAFKAFEMLKLGATIAVGRALLG